MAEDVEIGIDGAQAESGVKKIISALKSVGTAAEQLASSSSANIQRIYAKLDQLGNSPGISKYEKMMGSMGAATKAAASSVTSASNSIANSSAKAASAVDKMVQSLARLDSYKGPSGSAVERTVALFSAMSGMKLSSSLSRLAVLDSLSGYRGPSARSVESTIILLKELGNTRISSTVNHASVLQSLSGYRGPSTRAVENTRELFRILSTTKISGAAGMAGVLRELSSVATATTASATATRGATGALGGYTGALKATGAAHAHALDGLHAMNSAFFDLELIIGTVVGVVDKFSQGIMKWDSATATLDSVTHNAGETTAEMDFLVKTSEKFGISLMSITQAYSQFRVAGQYANLTVEQTQSLFDGLSQSARVYGLTEANNARIHQDLVKIMARGTLQMRELGQMERLLPSSMIAFAKSITDVNGHLGVTTSQMVSMMKTGQVSGKTLTDALGHLGENLRMLTIGGLADATNKIQAHLGTMGTAFTLLSVKMGNNGLKPAINELLDDFTRLMQNGGALSNVFVSLAQAFRFFADEIGVFVSGGAAVLVAYLLRTQLAINFMKVATDAYSASMARSTAASLAKAAATNTESAATVLATGSQVALTAATELTTVAVTAEAVAEGAAAGSAIALAGAEGIAAVAAGVMSAAFAAAGAIIEGVLTLLGAGNPIVGVIILALGGLWIALDRLNTVKIQSKLSTDALNASQSAMGNTANSAASNIFDAIDSYDKMDGAMRKLADDATKARDALLGVAEVKADAAIDKLEAKGTPGHFQAAHTGISAFRFGIGGAYVPATPDGLAGVPDALKPVILDGLAARKYQHSTNLNDLAEGYKLSGTALAKVDDIPRVNQNKQTQNAADTLNTENNNLKSRADQLVDYFLRAEHAANKTDKQIKADVTARYSSDAAEMIKIKLHPDAQAPFDGSKTGKGGKITPLGMTVIEAINEYGKLGDANRASLTGIQTEGSAVNQIALAKNSSSVSTAEQIKEALSLGQDVWKHIEEGLPSKSRTDLEAAYNKSSDPQNKTAHLVVDTLIGKMALLGRYDQSVKDAGPVGTKLQEAATALARVLDGGAANILVKNLQGQAQLSVAQSTGQRSIDTNASDTLAIADRAAPKISAQADSWNIVTRSIEEAKSAADAYIRSLEDAPKDSKDLMVTGYSPRQAAAARNIDIGRLADDSTGGLKAAAKETLAYTKLSASLTTLYDTESMHDYRPYISAEAAQAEVDHIDKIRTSLQSLVKFQGIAAANHILNSAYENAGVKLDTANGGHANQLSDFDTQTSRTLSRATRSGASLDEISKMSLERAQNRANLIDVLNAHDKVDGLNDYTQIFAGASKAKGYADDLNTVTKSLRQMQAAAGSTAQNFNLALEAIGYTQQKMAEQTATAQLSLTKTGTIVNSVIDKFSSSLNEFFATGRFNARQFARDIIATMASTAITQPLEASLKTMMSHSLGNDGAIPRPPGGQTSGMGPEFDTLATAMNSQVVSLDRVSAAADNLATTLGGRSSSVLRPMLPGDNGNVNPKLDSSLPSEKFSSGSGSLLGTIGGVGSGLLNGILNMTGLGAFAPAANTLFRGVTSLVPGAAGAGSAVSSVATTANTTAVTALTAVGLAPNTAALVANTAALAVSGASKAGSEIASIVAAAAAAVPAGHSGGIVGSLTGRSRVSPSVFVGAPHFSSGGIVGGEVPIIAHKGEEVLTTGDPRHRQNFSSSSFANPPAYVGSVVQRGGDQYSLQVTVAAPASVGNPAGDQANVEAAVKAANTAFETAMKKMMADNQRQMDMSVK